jgi:hypothetical protein
MDGWDWSYGHYPRCMDTWMWVVLWALVIGVVAFFLVRERLSGKNRIKFDADAPRGQADAEARVRRETHGPNTGGLGGGF